jgi:hypothetical protein
MLVALIVKSLYVNVAYKNCVNIEQNHIYMLFISFQKILESQKVILAFIIIEH